ncbi:TonB-dependent receptor domain-containing protein [Kordiimonas sp.]|uniref:TonB-dependent receptor domain-containing protein n=1 Tax=Kordiimonas sp. TaxID=1970157 RepID=UPI003B529630
MIGRKTLVKNAQRLALVSTIALSVAWSAAADDKTYRFDLESMPLGDALIQLTTQSNWQFLAPQELLQGKIGKAVSGVMSREDALKRLLAGTDLTYSIDDDGRVRIVPVKTEYQTPTGSEAGRSNIDPSQKVDGNKKGAEPNKTMTGELAPVELEEITVTGSHIRGARSASPVFIYSRKDIDMAGVASVPQFIQTLPQNFGGGLSESTSGLSAENNADLNLNSGSGINLRGLGNDSTLVLLNGRRLAPAGLGNFVDVSMVPLSAINRVEVLTDGASALYGSDAVGGVVNFILREDYDGAETRLRYGTATSGDLDDIQLGQTFGTVWDDGHALISYEFQTRDPLDAADRSFSQDARPLHQLLPKQKRHSAFLTVGQNLSDTVKVFADGFFSVRDSRQIRTSSFSPANFDISETEQYGGTLGSTINLSNDWQAELVASLNQSRTTQENKLLDETELAAPRIRKSGTWSIDGKADGALFRLSGGNVKLAAGGHFRRDTYTNSDDLKFNRDVFAAFGEIFAPFVSEENRAPGIERLELTIAARYEHYSDFGSSVDPKFGLLWSPIEGLSLRGTWGTAFRAPLFRELDESSVQGFLFGDVPNPASPNGSTLLALALGGNADLKPETATTWTAGIGFQPVGVPGLSLDVTYFDITYKNRISSVIALFDVFINPRFASLLDFDPDPAFLALLGSLPTSGNFAPGFSFTDAEVLADERESNQASTKVSGLDFSGSYRIDSDVGAWTFTVGGTYLFKNLEQLLESEEAADVLNTVGRPVDLKLRGGISWGYQDFSTNLVINYVDSYRDTRATPVAGVGSWTTADLIVSYNTGDHTDSAWLRNTVFSVSALNLFDQDPPFVTSNFGHNINYDPNNASPVGRTVSFQITKQW